MKTGKIINIVSAMLTVAALTACSQDDEQAVKQAEQTPTGVTISVTDLGMTPLKGTPTRALDRKDYTKDFVEGDQIGVFVVNGNDVTDNLKYTLNSAGTWEKAEGEAAITHVEGNVYFAYYPYQDGTDKYTIRTDDYEAGATTADAFFAGLIKRWRPAYDQSTQAKYSMQDLMVARATVNDGNVLTFQMEHQMALAEIRFAQEFGAGTAGPKYRFKTEENYYQGLDFSTGNEGTQSQKNIYRLIVRPNEVVNIQGDIHELLNGNVVTSNPNWYVQTSNQLAKGQYQVFGTAECLPNVQTQSFNLGDILYSDGTFQSSQKNGHGTPVGIVVYKNRGTSYSSTGTGNSSLSNLNGNTICEKGLTANYSGVTIAGRGLVMALEDVTRGTETGFIWGGNGSDEDNAYFPNGADARTPSTWNSPQSYQGLQKTNYLIGDGTKGTCGHTDHEFCKALYAWRNQSAHAVPVGCSDWFNGSVGQWNELLRSIYENFDGNTGSAATTKATWGGTSNATANAYGSLRVLLQNAGGTMMVYGDGTGSNNPTGDNQRYWMMDENSATYGTCIWFTTSFTMSQDGGGGQNKQTDYHRVRPLLAF